MKIPSISTYVRNTTNSGLLGNMKLGSGRINQSAMADMNRVVSQYTDYNANRSQMKAYYQKMYQKGDSTTSSDAATDTSGLKSQIDNINESAGKLTAVGKDSLFQKNAEGQYDTKAITEAVSSFVKDYNALNKAASGAKEGTQVSQKADSLDRLSATYSTILSKVGITVGADDSLSLDEKKLKSADMTLVKALFNGSNSYAGRVSDTASQMKGVPAGGKPNFEQMMGYQTYNQNGFADFKSSYMTGSMLDYMG